MVRYLDDIALFKITNKEVGWFEKETGEFLGLNREQAKEQLIFNYFLFKGEFIEIITYCYEQSKDDHNLLSVFYSVKLLLDLFYG